MTRRDGFLTLGIETSCDDTAVALLEGGRTVLAEMLSSQPEHAAFGGVVPEFAARRHIENLLPLIDAVLRNVGVGGRDLDLIAVTRGPGLMGSLLVGVETARALSQAWGVPVIGVNHLEGHLFAPLLDADLTPPFLSLIASGGHTEIVRVDAFGRYALLGTTRDDAAGEAYDKAAKILGLSYPGGPEIDRLARTGNPRAFDFPTPLKNTDKIEFSFSGLKTALLWQVNRLKEGGAGNALPVADLCASFQRAVTETLVAKAALAVRQTNIRVLSVSGGVAANSGLRRALRERRGWKVCLPEPSRCTDNAAMIAMAGRDAWKRRLQNQNQNHQDSLEPLVPDPSLDLPSASTP
ncbi:MAG: tRNA (adenosine(37)-N6)-threonylcarbamoyltransferase complex transferase subunit TsaD [Synergistaceae bacterium]|nr:tRNA (adenosine(37)-N6)-threonylcarbamoyltransferase complex transferase subunit TsaD [Synergistaceae bacterium]